MHLRLKDYFLSMEEFEIYECSACGLLFTAPVPPDTGPYYRSENYLSHNGNRKGLVPKIYNMVKKVNIRSKFRLVANAFSACRGNSPGIALASLMDIGCGMGDFLHYAKEKGCKTAGIEPVREARMAAEAKLGEEIMTPDKLRHIPDSSFDIVTLWHVLEHVNDLKTEIGHLQRIVKKNGIIVLALPNYRSFDAGFYKDKWAAYDVPRHLYHFSSTAIKGIFNGTSLRLMDIQPLKWDSFYVSILSERYCGSRLALAKGIVNGCRSNMKAFKTGEYSSLVYVLKKV